MGSEDDWAREACEINDVKCLGCGLWYCELHEACPECGSEDHLTEEEAAAEEMAERHGWVTEEEKGED